MSFKKLGYIRSRGKRKRGKPDYFKKNMLYRRQDKFCCTIGCFSITLNLKDKHNFLIFEKYMVKLQNTESLTK